MRNRMRLSRLSIHPPIDNRINSNNGHFNVLGRSIRGAGHRSVHFGGVPVGHTGHGLHTALEPSCSALAMPNLLRGLSARWRPASGDYPNIGQRNRRTGVRLNR